MRIPLKQFLIRHVSHGEIKQLSNIAGLHPNSVYCWAKGRNQPSVTSMIWFLKALSREKNLVYEQLWLEYLYLVEGTADAYEESQRWIQSKESQDEETHEQSEG